MIRETTTVDHSTVTAEGIIVEHQPNRFPDEIHLKGTTVRNEGI